MPVIDLDRERHTVELDAALESVGPFRRGQQVQLALVSCAVGGDALLVVRWLGGAVQRRASRRARTVAAPLQALPFARRLLCRTFRPLVQVGLSWLLAAIQTLTAVVWACLDPLRHLTDEATCARPDDTACADALAAGALCSLPREAWAWRAP